MKTEYGVKDIQMILHNMVKQFKKICDKNNITYYLVKGGLIGAIRHKGFIPWDPDIDFAIHVNQLELFCSAMRAELEQPFKLCFYDKDPSYEYLFPRIGICNGDYRQIHLDVFLIANAPDDKDEQNRYFSSLNRMEKFNTVRNSKIFRPVNNYLNRIVLVGTRLFTFWIPKSLIREKYIKLAKKYEDTTSYYIQIGAVEEYGKKYLMPKLWFGEGTLKEFEDIYLNCPKDYDSYLTQMYRNYMQYPPQKDIERQEKRIWKLDPIIFGEICDDKNINKEINQ